MEPVLTVLLRKLTTQQEMIPNILPFTPAAVASVAIFAAPDPKALGDKPPTQVSAANPAASPAVTSNADETGRIAINHNAPMTLSETPQ